MPSDHDIERLIRQVVDLVLAQLQRPEDEGEGEAALRRTIHLLLPIQTRHIDGLADQLRRLRRRGHGVRCGTTSRVLAWLESTGRRADLADEVIALDEACLENALGNYGPRDLVVLGSMGFACADRLAALDDEDPLIRLVSQALLKGVRVLAVDDDLVAGQAGSLSGQAERSLRELAGLGIELLPGAELAARIAREEAADTTLSQSLAGLLTEADVERLASAGQRRVVLGINTIVTPLARSRAGALSLELVEIGV
jgi:hypothetical protein